MKPTHEEQTMMIPRPQADEHGAYYLTYINRVPEGSDVLAVLSAQPEELKALLQGVSEEQANMRPAPGEWSIKEVLGHICDTERVFAFRALWAARGDVEPLPGFEQDNFVKATDFNARTVSDLVSEFEYQRLANVLCFRTLTDEELVRKGSASGKPITARALLYMLAGHVLHHIESLKTSYHVGA
jgi:hypothetical protein